MDETIRRSALLATAKIALAMTVFGCLGEVQLDDGTAQPGEEPDEDGTDESATLPGVKTPVPSDSSELACQAPGPLDEVGLDPEQLACCSDLLEPFLPSEPDAWAAWDEAANAPEVQGCCRVAIAHFDDDPTGTDVSWEALGPCCDALDSPTGPACTPWGPPVPPAVHGELPLLGGPYLHELEVA